MLLEWRKHGFFFFFLDIGESVLACLIFSSKVPLKNSSFGSWRKLVGDKKVGKKAKIMSSLLLLCWKVIQLDTSVDNLTVDPDTGDVLAGCHPNVMKLILYNPKDPPQSEVSKFLHFS